MAEVTVRCRAELICERCRLPLCGHDLGEWRRHSVSEVQIGSSLRQWWVGPKYMWIGPPPRPAPPAMGTTIITSANGSFSASDVGKVITATTGERMQITSVANGTRATVVVEP